MSPLVKVLPAALLAVASCTHADGAASKKAAQNEPAAEAAMQTLVAEGFSGSVLAACDQDVLFDRSYGVDAPDNAVIRYWVASITKALTAVSILQLQEADALSIDDALAKYFPAAPDDKAGITLLQLLTHQSGLPQAYAAEGHADMSEAARAIFTQDLLFTPGESFNYSNDNFTLLGMIVEIASGKPYKDYIRDKVAKPIGIDPVAFWPDPVRNGESIPPLLHPLEPPEAEIDWGFLGAHGARLSVEDMHAFAAGLKQGRLLDTESLRQLFGDFYTTSSGVKIGMGFYADSDDAGRSRLATRGSDTSGGNAVIYYIGDSGLIVVAATNAGPEEEKGRPGWSRQARDVLVPVYAPAAGADVCATAQN